MKKYLIIALVILAGVSCFLMFRLLDRDPAGPPPIPTEMVIEQGKPTWIPPAEPEKVGPLQFPDPTPGPPIRVETSVEKKELSQIIEQAENLTDIQPDQAIVTREEDRHGNTTITVLTPVMPIDGGFDEDELQPDRPPGEIPNLEPGDWATPAVQPEQKWMVVETEVFIPRVRQRLKPIFLVSDDLDIEAGIGFEVWRLEKKPNWMPQKAHDVLEGMSIDLIGSINRGGGGIAIEATQSFELGGGVTLDWGSFIRKELDPKMEVEAVMYVGIQF